MTDKKNSSRLLRYLSFDHLITPVLIQIIYWIGVIAIFAVGIGSGVSSIQSQNNSIVAGLLAVSAIFIFLLLWRLVNELWILVFNIYARLVEIRDLLARPHANSDGHQSAPSLTIFKQ